MNSVFGLGVNGPCVRNECVCDVIGTSLFAFDTVVKTVRRNVADKCDADFDTSLPASYAPGLIIR